MVRCTLIIRVRSSILKANTEKRILAVDDARIWRDILRENLEESKIAHTVVGSTAEATTAIATGEYTGVITDGLNGGWKTVSAAARAAGARCVLMSLSLESIAAAHESGIPAHDKAGMSPELIQNIIQQLVSAGQPTERPQ